MLNLISTTRGRFGLLATIAVALLALPLTAASADQEPPRIWGIGSTDSNRISGTSALDIYGNRGWRVSSSLDSYVEHAATPALPNPPSDWVPSHGLYPPGWVRGGVSSVSVKADESDTPSSGFASSGPGGLVRPQFGPLGWYSNSDRGRSMFVPYRDQLVHTGSYFASAKRTENKLGYGFDTYSYARSTAELQVGEGTSSDTSASGNPCATYARGADGNTPTSIDPEAPRILFGGFGATTATNETGGRIRALAVAARPVDSFALYYNGQDTGVTLPKVNGNTGYLDFAVAPGEVPNGRYPFAIAARASGKSGLPFPCVQHLPPQTKRLTTGTPSLVSARIAKAKLALAKGWVQAVASSPRLRSSFAARPQVQRSGRQLLKTISSIQK